MMKRAVLYARVSRDDSRQDGRNLEGQIEMGQAYANKRGYIIVAELKEDDKGASGAEINLPGLNAVREMANNGQFDILVVREIDRLSRSLAKQLIVEQELKRQGVEIEYVLGEYPDTPEGNFMRHIRATVAEYEREKINERVVRGRYSKVQAGSVFVSGNPPYGYCLVQNDGQYRLEIYEPEAEVVRMIFEWYLSGLSSFQIANRLSDMGMPTYADNRSQQTSFPYKKRSNSGWSSGTVQHILKNETYAGVWHYGKYVGRARLRKRSVEEQMAVPVPPIVSRECWETTVVTRQRNRSSRKHSSDYDYLLKGFIFCQSCGHRIHASTTHVGGKVYPYYRCNARRREVDRDCFYGTIHFPADLVDAAVWNWIESLLTDPDQLLLGLEAYQAQKEQTVAPLRDRLHLVEEMLDAEEVKLKRLLDLYLSGDFPMEMLTERKNRLETQIRALKNEKLELTVTLEEQTITQEQITLVQRFGEEIAGELETADGDLESMRHIVNIIGLQVWLSDKEGEKAAFVRCGIGEQLLSLAPSATCAHQSPRNRRHLALLPKRRAPAPQRPTCQRRRLHGPRPRPHGPRHKVDRVDQWRQY